MKNIINSILLSLMLVVMVSDSSSAQMAAQTPPAGTITYQTFYDNLSPYGTWINYPGYGHVWNPRTDGDFRPYATNGNWAYSNQGWAWQSNYPWGWAPFHYGSWLYDDSYGWLWVPGYDWSPAWVTWGSVDDYYCWAPIMPGVHINLQFGSWRPNAFYWNICGRSHIYDRNLSNVLIREGQLHGITSRISIMNVFNTTTRHNYYAKGPDLHDVERYTRRNITPINFKDVNKISANRQAGNLMNVYRPSIQNPQPHEYSSVEAGKKNVYRPSIQNPQPHEYRSVEAGKINPIQKDEQHPSMGRMEQRNNIESLPTHRTQGPVFSRSSGGGQGRGGRHR